MKWVTVCVPLAKSWNLVGYGDVLLLDSAIQDRRSRGCRSSLLKVPTYLTLVRPKLEYASFAWDPYLKCHIGRLERVKRAAAGCNLYERLRLVVKVHFHAKPIRTLDPWRKDKKISFVRYTDPVISDHSAVHWETSCLEKPSFERKEIEYGKLRSVGRGRFLSLLVDRITHWLRYYCRYFCNKNCYLKARCSQVLWGVCMRENRKEKA